MNIPVEGVLFVAIGIVVLLGLSFWLGYSAGESDAHKKILQLQQQNESAQRWKDVLQKMNERGLV
jgi:hypothetical protein